jgi:hypothetical protein
MIPVDGLLIFGKNVAQKLKQQNVHSLLVKQPIFLFIEHQFQTVLLTTLIFSFF